MTNITYHPSDELLRSHANGELPESLSVAVSLHCDLCSECKNKVEAITQQLAEITWQSNSQAMYAVSNEATVDYTSMLDSIMQLDVDDAYLVPTPAYHVSIADKIIEVPYLLHRYDDLKWNQLGAVSRARLIEEQDTRSNLLHIAAGGEIPNHTHKGFELTLLLDGSFEDGKTFMNNTKLCSITSTLGNTDTLLLHPASSSHLNVPKDVRLENNITDGLIRVSVGIENKDDLIFDIESALASF